MSKQYVSFDQAIDGEYGRENFRRIAEEHPEWTNGQVIEYLESEKEKKRKAIENANA